MSPSVGLTFTFFSNGSWTLRAAFALGSTLLPGMRPQVSAPETRMPQITESSTMPATVSLSGRLPTPPDRHPRGLLHSGLNLYSGGGTQLNFVGSGVLLSHAAAPTPAGGLESPPPAWRWGGGS